MDANAPALRFVQKEGAAARSSGAGKVPEDEETRLMRQEWEVSNIYVYNS